ncbi:DUF2625 family protein [Gorillibacterium sp. sgz5001074]|uniref:DUF2625 family protein n=1 Tax=Gorillibacterium sp. sgz5001074 TaxID=3446695 RepID=UPI003F66714E
MKTKSDLIFEDSTWLMIQDWIKKSKVDVTVLNNERAKGEEVLFQLQITNKSTLGSIALETGGILADNGWLRILGSGNPQIFGTLNVKNAEFPYSDGFIVAYDVVGGVFAINSGLFDNKTRNVYYFAPDTLEWEDTGKGYTDFIYWVFHGELDRFYESYRWKDWISNTQNLRGDQGLSIYPYLWSEQGRDVNSCHKGAIPIKEIWDIQNEFKNQLKTNYRKRR